MTALVAEGLRAKYRQTQRVLSSWPGPTVVGQVRGRIGNHGGD